MFPRPEAVPAGNGLHRVVAREQAPVVVVGASLGGLAALADPATARRVAGLVLVDVVPDPDPARVRSWLAEQGLDGRFPALVEDILAAGPRLLATAGELTMPVLLVRGDRSRCATPTRSGCARPTPA